MNIQAQIVLPFLQRSIAASRRTSNSPFGKTGTTQRGLQVQKQNFIVHCDRERSNSHHSEQGACTVQTCLSCHPVWPGLREGKPAPPPPPAGRYSLPGPAHLEDSLERSRWTMWEWTSGHHINPILSIKKHILRSKTWYFFKTNPLYIPNAIY